MSVSPAAKRASNKYSVDIDDANADGNDDLALLSSKKGVPVYLARGNGDGTFGLAAAAFVNSDSTQPDFVGPGYSTKGQFVQAVANVNAGGAADLIALERKPTAIDPVAFVALDNGKGFGRPVLGATFTGKVEATQPVIPADINGDGRDDLLSFGADSSGNALAAVLINNGNGNFGSPIVRNFPYKRPKNGMVRVGDFNGDGNDDIAVLPTLPKTPGALDLNDLFVRIIPSNGDGTFGTPIERHISGLGSFIDQGFRDDDVLVGDVSGDGKDDLLFIAGDRTANPSLLLSITDGTSNNTPIAVPTPLPADLPVTRFGLADLDGDGTEDLVGFGPPTATTLPAFAAFGDGSVRGADNSQTFANAVALSLVLPSATTLPATAVPVLADINGDNRDDLVVVDHDPQRGTRVSPAFVALANADGTLAPAIRASDFVSPGADQSLPADVNGDGLTDLVSINNIKSKSTHLITFTLARSDGTLGGTVA